MTCDDAAMWSIPVFRENRELIEGKNPFLTHFGSQSESEWLATLTRSIETPVLDGVAFPGFRRLNFRCEFMATPTRSPWRRHSASTELSKSGSWRLILLFVQTTAFSTLGQVGVASSARSCARSTYTICLAMNPMFGSRHWHGHLIPDVNIVNGSTEPPTTFAHGTLVSCRAGRYSLTFQKPSPKKRRRTRAHRQTWCNVVQ